MTDEAPGGQGGDRGSSVRQLLLLGLGVGATYIIALLLWPFLPAIVTSAVLAALFYPAHKRIVRRICHRSVAAFAGTTIIFFLILLPLVAISVALAREIMSSLEWLSQSAADVLAPQGRVARWLQTAASQLGLEPDRVREGLGQQVRQLAGGIAGRTLGIISGLGGWVIQAGIALFTLYYLLRDGDRVVAAIKWIFPLRTEDAERLVERALEVTYATVYGNVAVAMVQGTLGGLAFWALGLPSAALWGTIMGVLALLPAIGTALVWVPAAVLLISAGDLVRGIILLAFGALVISTIDNLLRAAIVSGRAQLHPLIAFFSVLGGLVVFGATGVFIGPVLFVLSLAVIEMARLAVEPDAAARDALRASMPLASRTAVLPRDRPVLFTRWRRGSPP